MNAVTSDTTPWYKKFFAYLVKEKTDQLFCVLRLLRPNLRLPGEKGPVFITRFRDVQEALSRPEVFNIPYAPMMDPCVGPFMLGRDNTTINQRDKGIMRALIQREDMPKVHALVTQLAEQCINEGHVNGQLEVVRNLSRKAPILLTGEFFGFPGPDMESMLRWSRATQYDMFHNQDNDPRIHAENVQAGQEMQAYLKVLIPQRREELKANPELDDTVSRLLKLQTPEVIHFDDERIGANIMGLLVGGVETTSQAIVQILDQLFKRPQELAGAIEAARADDDAKVSKYCWEALRFNPINPVVFRNCVEDYVIASGTLRRQRVRKGDSVVVCTRSAMQDGFELPSPRQFKLDRPDYHYIHFGFGLHTCLGDHVSRVQIPEIVKRLLLRKNLRRAPGAAGEIDMRGGAFPESFSVQFDPE